MHKDIDERVEIVQKANAAIPEGWEIVLLGVVESGDRIWNQTNYEYVTQDHIGKSVDPYYAIIRRKKIPPEIQVPVSLVDILKREIKERLNSETRKTQFGLLHSAFYSLEQSHFIELKEFHDLMTELALAEIRKPNEMEPTTAPGLKLEEIMKSRI